MKGLQMAKANATHIYDEARGWVAAALKLGVVGIFFRTAYELGVPSITLSEAGALLALTMGVVAGLYFIRR